MIKERAIFYYSWLGGYFLGNDYLFLFVVPTCAPLQQPWPQVPTLDEHLSNLRKKERKSRDGVFTDFVYTTQQSDKKIEKQKKR